MKQNSNKNRSNGRHVRFNNNRRPNNIVTRNTPFDSSSPAGRIRGTSQQLVEKYMSLAKDAKNQDDRVLYETYLQYADHYARMLAMAIANEQQQKIQIQPQVVQNVQTEVQTVACEQVAITEENNSQEITNSQSPKVEVCLQVNSDTTVLDAKEQEQGSVEAEVKKPKVQKRVRKIAVKKENISETTQKTENNKPEKTE